MQKIVTAFNSHIKVTPAFLTSMGSQVRASLLLLYVLVIFDYSINSQFKYSVFDYLLNSQFKCIEVLNSTSCRIGALLGEF